MTRNTAGTFAPFFDGLDRDHGANVVTLTVGNITGGSEVRLHGTQGFEVLVPASEHVPNPASAALGPAPAASEMIWLSVAITGHSTTSVTVSGVPKSATKIRYNWWSNPCGEDCFKCVRVHHGHAVRDAVWRAGLSSAPTLLCQPPCSLARATLLLEYSTKSRGWNVIFKIKTSSVSFQKKTHMLHMLCKI